LKDFCRRAKVDVDIMTENEAERCAEESTDIVEVTCINTIKINLITYLING